ncbi:MAG TPA: dienelactone hydrolase family protein [Methylomirabilota bacterium]|nr:dienelactone hydrolase family protein [Methylomirabilota bacterium]
MLRRVLLLVSAAPLLASCYPGVSFFNATPNAPVLIGARLVKPDGPGPFPAAVLLHGCGGVDPYLYGWADWLAARGYVALVVDSFGPRQEAGTCRSDPDEAPITARLDDAIGALKYLQSQPFVLPDRIAAIGWSQGGVYAIAVINGPSLERARRRGVEIPATGFAAAIGIYPGGCSSLAGEQVVRPLLVLIGEADDWTLAHECRAMVEAMRGRGADASLVLYPGAHHYFDVPGQRKQILRWAENPNKRGGYGPTVSYQAEADADAHRRVEGFLAKHLKGSR